MDEQSADLEDLAETFSRDRNRNRHLNSLVVPTTLERFEQGTDSIEALRQRVADITSRPTAEPHIIWNAQNFLEQVEAAMEAKAVIQELRNTPLSEAVSREECIEILRRFEADHKDTTEPEPCPHCKGEHWFGNYDHPDHCPVCGGSGLVNSP